jgi:glycosyltransferase involved in cell wall biosynthesis
MLGRGEGRREPAGRLGAAAAARPSNPKVSVVIAALNEAENLPLVLPLIDPSVHEILLVDGLSDDGTGDVALRLHPRVRVLAQAGSGKGDALRTGFAEASGDLIVTLDGDGSTDPAEIPAYVGALCAGADYVKGSRFLHGAGTTDMPLHRRLGNRVFVLLVRCFFGGRYSDLCYGYNAFWKDVLPSLNLSGDGFEIETVMNIHALRAGLRVVEVASVESVRVHGVGKLKTFADGWRVLRTILRERRCSYEVPVEHDASGRENGRPAVASPLVDSLENFEASLFPGRAAGKSDAASVPGEHRL